jgi:hypothetical protein
MLLNAIIFLVAGMLIQVVSWRARKNHQIIHEGGYQNHTRGSMHIRSLSKNRMTLNSTNTGLTFKVLFFDLLSLTCLCKILFLAIIVRGLGSLIILTLRYKGPSSYWLYLLSLNLPSLLFISTFSLFLYFIALGVIEEGSEQTNLVKPFAIVFNVFSYLSFLVIAFFSKRPSIFTQI